MYTCSNYTIVIINHEILYSHANLPYNVITQMHVFQHHTHNFFANKVTCRHCVVAKSIIFFLQTQLFTVVKTAGENCTYGDVRLVNGSNQYEGRVEVCVWVWVCRCV